MTTPTPSVLDEFEKRFEIRDGVLVWKQPNGIAVKPGDPAGFDNNGYHQVRLKGKSYHVLMIGWYLLSGHWPGKIVRYMDPDNPRLEPNSLTLGRVPPKIVIDEWRDIYGVILKPDGWHAGQFGPFDRPDKALIAQAKAMSVNAQQDAG